MKQIPIIKNKNNILDKIMSEQMQLNRETRRFLIPRLKKIVSSIYLIFNEIKEFRQRGKLRYPLGYVLSIMLIGLLAGKTDCENIVKFLKLNWLEIKTIIGFDYGVPSEDQLCKLLAKIDPEQMRSCLKRWLKCFYKSKKNTQYAADGTLPRAAKNKVLNLKSAYIHNMLDVVNNLIVDVVEVEEKSNEKIATLDLLENTDLNGVVLTTDALNTTRSIMRLCFSKGGDFVLPVKDGNKKLNYDIANTFFAHYPEKDTLDPFYLQEDTTIEQNGSRFEKRVYLVSQDLSGIDTDYYPDIVAIGFVQRYVEEYKLKKNSSQSFLKKSYSWHCVVLSKAYTAKEMGLIIRNHWKVESFHWLKDNYLGEDRSTNRVGNSRVNFAILRRIAFNFLSIVDKLIDELSDGATLIEKTAFFSCNLHLAVQMVFGWDENWSERLSQYYNLLIEDLEIKEQRPSFLFI